MKRTAYSPVLLLVLVYSLVVVSGCQTPLSLGGRSTEPIVEEPLGEVPPVESAFPPAAAARFDDIPVPEGMKMDSKRSFVFESGNLQIGYLIYTSKLTPKEAAQFFLDALPTSAGWTLINVLQYNDITITMRKPDKDIVIHVSPKRFGGCVARISLTPKNGSL